MTEFEPSRDQATPFAPTRVPERRSFVSRLLGRADVKGAIGEVQNLLAAHPLAEIEPSEISDILLERGVSGTAAREVARAVWTRAMRQFTRDDVLSPDEIAYLTQLRASLGLSERDALAMHADLAAHRYGDVLSLALGDQKLSEEDWDRLDRLAQTTGLSDEVRSAIHAEAVSAVFKSAIDRSIRDRRLAPREQRYLEELARNLGIPQADRAASEATLQKFALLWRIKNKELPTVDPPIPLRGGEVCHFAAATEWHELRAGRVARGPGIGGTIRIAKGLSYRVGRVARQAASRDALMAIDSGTILVTSERVVFDGVSTSTIITHDALIGLEVFSDAIKLERTTGENPYLFLGGDIEVAAAVVSEVLARATG